MKQKEFAQQFTPIEPPIEPMVESATQRRRSARDGSDAESCCRAPAVEPFEPFPIDVLPEPVRGFVNVGAKSHRKQVANGIQASVVRLQRTCDIHAGHLFVLFQRLGKESVFVAELFVQAVPVKASFVENVLEGHRFETTPPEQTHRAVKHVGAVVGNGAGHQVAEYQFCHSNVAIEHGFPANCFSSGQSRFHYDLSGEGSMHGAPVGDLQQPCFLLVVQRSF